MSASERVPVEAEQRSEYEWSEGMERVQVKQVGEYEWGEGRQGRGEEEGTTDGRKGAGWRRCKKGHTNNNP